MLQGRLCDICRALWRAGGAFAVNGTEGTKPCEHGVRWSSSCRQRGLRKSGPCTRRAGGAAWSTQDSISR